MNKSILIIDDEPDILKTLASALGMAGYHVVSAPGGEAGLKLFREQSFDLVITDMRMPGMTGIQVIEQVKAMDPDAETIVLTGYATLDNAVEALRHVGAFDYLTKPLDNIDELFMAVEKALEKRRLTVENRELLQQLKEKEVKLLKQNQILQENERRYRELTDSLPFSIFEADAKGMLTFLNPFALESLQYTHDDLAAGIQLWDMLDSEKWDRTLDRSRAIVAEMSYETLESEATRKDGTSFPVLARISPIYHGAEISGFRGFALDITEQKRHLEEMTRMAKLESLGTLAGGLAHDFNNILSVIIGNIELALFEIPSQTNSALALADALEGCRTATQLTGRFITFSEGDAPRKKAAALGAMLSDMVPLFFSGANVRCELSVPRNLWAAHGDSAQLRQAIHNVISNAIDAMPHGGVVTIVAQNAEITQESHFEGVEMPSGHYVKVNIQDRGKGIPEKLLHRVLDPYFSTKERGVQKGMGLGLTTAYAIVRKHGGFLFLESKKAEGTNVSIFLPAVPPEKGKKAAPVKDDPLLADLKVLVMDDEVLLLATAEKMFSRLGCRVETSQNAEDAVRLYKKSLDTGDPFGLVFLDLTVKGGPGGKEAVRKMLKLNPRVRAVVCSGYGDDPVMNDFEDYGFRAALPKPFTTASLRDAAIKALR
jgi:two-component system cell cycle sensor histidine kinase/response regulator CckA